MSDTRITISVFLIEINQGSQVFVVLILHILRAFPEASEEALFGLFHLAAELAIGKLFISFKRYTIDFHLVTPIYTDKHTFLGTQGIRWRSSNMYLGI